MARSQFLLSIVLALILLAATELRAAHAKCTCWNNSKKDIIIIPADASVNVNIEVKAGAIVEVPSTHQHCYLQNKETGHKMGDYRLPDDQLIVVVNAKLEGKVDVWVGGLIAGVLQLIVNICVSL